MKDLYKKKILNRMSYLIGHLKGVVKMIEEDEYCIDIINQNQGVISALKKANEALLRNHLETCVTQAVRGKSQKKRKQVLQEIVKIFGKSS